MENLGEFLNTLYIAAVVLGGLMVLVAIPMMLGIIKPNRVYGFRTKKTLSNEKIWYKANAFGGWALFLGGLVILAATGLIYYYAYEAMVDFWYLVMLGPIVLVVLASLLFARKL